MTSPQLDSGERLLAELRSDKGRYWRDHAILAVLGMLSAGIVLTVMGSEHAAIGSLGAIFALAVRGLYLAREQLSFRWYLTDKRFLMPGGQQVMLLEIETVRKLMGDMQIITRGGDKHLIKHLANSDAVVAQILDAQKKRSRKQRD